MREISEIQAEIDEVQAELANVRGTEAEVYTRIVGYYRSVRNWNKGKRDEYNKRRLFEPDMGKTDAALAKFMASSGCGCGAGGASAAIAKVELFTKSTCPNCPPVVDFCKGLSVQTVTCNVDSSENAKLAQAKSVRACPTAICYDAQGKELARAYSVKDLESLFLASARA